MRARTFYALHIFFNGGFDRGSSDGRAPGKRSVQVARRFDRSRVDRSPRRAEQLDAEALGLEPLRPAIRFEAGLRHEAADERARVGNLAPDAGQEEGAPIAGREDEAVAVGLEPGGKLRFACRGNWPRVREDRDVETKPGEAGLVERGKRGSAKPALTVLATASSMSGRRGAGEPMQPRSRPPSVSVTKVARQDESAGRPPSKPAASGLPPLRAAALKLAVQAESRRARSASMSRAEPAYSRAKAP